MDELIIVDGEVSFQEGYRFLVIVHKRAGKENLNNF